MIPYGKKKRGSAKIHPHNECDICGESDPSKARARRETGIDEGIDEHGNLFCINIRRWWRGIVVNGAM